MVPLVNPAARTRRMWQGNGRRLAARMYYDMLASDELIEGSRRQEELDREAANEDQELGLNDRELALEPLGAVLTLARRRYPVAPATRARTGITPGDGRDV